MGRIVLGIVGIILAIWLITMVIGLVVGLIKWALIIGIIAVVAFLLMKVIGGNSRSQT